MVIPLQRWVTMKANLSLAALFVLAGLSARGQYTPVAGYPPTAGVPSYMVSTPWQSGAFAPVLGASPRSSPASISYGGPQSYGMGYMGPGATYPSMMQPYPSMPSLPYQPYVCPPHPCLPGAAPPAPAEPSRPGAEPSRPGETVPPSQTSPSTEQPGTTPPSDQNLDLNAPDLPSEQASAAGTGQVALAAPGGYLDNPIPITTFRLRFDAAYGMNHPDRAEYFYGAWGELGFHPHGIQGKGVFFDPHAIGPVVLPSNVNFQQPDMYLEYAFLNRFSAFVDAPYRVINYRQLLEDNPESEGKRSAADQPAPGSRFFPEPEAGAVDSTPRTNHNGFSDFQFGFKAALLASPTQFLTFQLRTYTPTGDSFHGLGTGHWSVEPSLLLYERWNRLVLQGQLTDWIPIHGGEAGNVVSYGAGLGYAVYQRGNFAVMPITEFLGWTVLNGYEAVFGTISATAPPGLELPRTHGVLDAGGNTIVNGKFGVRTFFGNGHSLFFGYGRALTGTHWYTDDFRVEYRLFFGPLRRTARSL